MTLIKVGAPFLKKAAEPRSPIPPVLVRLLAAQTALGLLAITFGTSMLVSQLIPGSVIGVILAANGGVLLYLLHLLVTLDREQNERPTPAL